MPIMEAARLPSPSPGPFRPGPESRERDPRVSVVLPGWTDVTSIFATACDRLPTGKAIHIPGYTMYDTMGSIEVRSSLSTVQGAM